MKLGPRRLLATGASIALIAIGATTGVVLTTGVANAQLQHANLVFTKTAAAPTATPIKDVVVIYNSDLGLDANGNLNQGLIFTVTSRTSSVSSRQYKRASSVSLLQTTSAR